MCSVGKVSSDWLAFGSWCCTPADRWKFGGKGQHRAGFKRRAFGGKWGTEEKEVSEELVTEKRDAKRDRQAGKWWQRERQVEG